MRFDDMAATVIAQAGAAPEARRIAWRQLVDLAAQKRADADDAGSIYEALRAWRPLVPQAIRTQAAESLSGRIIPPALFSFFAEDVPNVVAPLARTIPLRVEEWKAVLPQLSPPVRALLRHRTDLDSEVLLALASFGQSDLIISGPESQEAETSVANTMGGGAQIRELVDRIEAYRRDHPVTRVHVRAKADTETRAENFRFETGTDGVMIWVEGASRSPLVGTAIGATADTPDHGVDGYAAGAFRRRAPFRDARLTVAGSGAAAGEWRISAIPFFAARDGRFTGYRGIARRPRSDEVARSASDGLYGSSLRPESLRQLVHELRTPLNAILGFAEMIDSQMLGPAAQDYRDRAVGIVGEARRLLSAVDDLDTAARVDSNALRLERAQVDGSTLLSRICADLEPLSEERGVELRVNLPAEAPSLSVDPVAIDRMFSRLLSAVIAVSERGEVLQVRLESRPEASIELRVQRPEALRGQEERALLDPGYSPDGDWPDAPLLGLGFALRLVRNLASAASGKFLIGESSFALILPGVRESVDAGESKG